MGHSSASICLHRGLRASHDPWVSVIVRCADGHMIMSVMPQLRTADAQPQVHDVIIICYTRWLCMGIVHCPSTWFDHSLQHCLIWIICQQVLPLIASCVSVICGLMMIYAIGSPRGTTAFQTTPQGTCIILAALASLASILMCMGVPKMSRRHRSRKPIPIKRMNLLGLVGSSGVYLWTCDVCSATSAI